MLKLRNVFFIFLMTFSLNIPAKALENFVVFGDSLSDNGNMYEYLKHQIPPSPPYFEGRFSNGYIWVEHLAQDYFKESWKQHILNYAFGGAGVGWLIDASSNQDEQILFSLSREIDSYLLSHNDKASPNSLFSVWIGSNNYLVNHSRPNKIAARVNQGIKKSLDLLASKGAKHILIINLPDIGKSPIAKLLYAEKELSECSKQHNIYLQDAVTSLTKKYPDVQWILFDIGSLFTDVYADPAKYGFTNISDSCYQSLATLGIPGVDDEQFVLKISANLIKNEQLSKDACDGHFFFDSVHPTVAVHKALANILQEVLKDNNIDFKKEELQ